MRASFCLLSFLVTLSVTAFGQEPPRACVVVAASAVWRPTGGVDTLDATRRAVDTFVARGVLEQ